jgi:hypothetical protein
MNSEDPFDTILKNGESISCVIAYHDIVDDFQEKHTMRASAQSTPFLAKIADQ